MCKVREMNLNLNLDFLRHKPEANENLSILKRQASGVKKRWGGKRQFYRFTVTLVKD